MNEIFFTNIFFSDTKDFQQLILWVNHAYPNHLYLNLSGL
jgi:hypothetical protein